MKTLNLFRLTFIVTAIFLSSSLGSMCFAQSAEPDLNKTKDVLNESDPDLTSDMDDISDTDGKMPDIKSESSLDPAETNSNAKVDDDLSADLTNDAVMPAEEPETHWIDKEVANKDAKIEDVTNELVIDKAYREAKDVELMDAEEAKKAVKKVEEVPVEKSFATQTDEEIIDGLIKDDLRDKKIDLDFNAATLNDLFMTLGTSGNMNIMLDPALKSLTIDVHLKQVTLKEAFILIASAHNLGFQRIENSVFVTTKDKLKEQTVASKVIKLRNIKADETRAMVADLIKVVNVGEEINSLIVIGQPNEIAKVENVIKSIDRPQPQVLLEAKIVEVNRDALKDLGIDWSDSMQVDFQESGRPIDIPDTADATKNIFKFGSLERSPLNFTTLIKMLENHNKAKVLSSPRVSTMNNKEAEIFVGDRIPYTITTTTGGVSTTEVRFEEPGIRLKITPSIIDGEFVVIKVEPEVSYIFSFRGPDDQYPWIKKRQTTAYVRVRNNKPFVLGGILNQEDKKNLSKVPMLGNLPMLGGIFSYEKKTVTDTELIISVTPTIVQGDV